MVASLDPAAVYQALQNGHGCLIDVRQPSDWSQGVAIGAQCLSPMELLAQVENLKMAHQRLFIICHRGNQSRQLVQQIQDDHFINVSGGYHAWQAAALPTEIPATDANLAATYGRYERQMRLSGFDLAAQQRLQQSHVLVVGAGGLGCPALLYLAGSGVGRLTLLDDDCVALHNLHRQILFTEADIGQPKATVAAQRLQQLNTRIDINAQVARLDQNNVDALVGAADLVLDGSDNIATRQVINDSCLQSKKPWIYAAVDGFEIQVSLFSGDPSQPCYRCLFPDIQPDAVANCDAQGVLGPVPGMAAMLQVTEAIKHLAQLQPTLIQQMLTYDVLHHRFKVLKYPANQSAGCVHECGKQ